MHTEYEYCGRDKQNHYENVTNNFNPKSARLDITFMMPDGEKMDFL